MPIRLRFLPWIASQSADYGIKHERFGITPEQVSNLTNEAVEAIAEAYVTSNGVRSAREGGKNRKPIARAKAEPATSYLDKLIRSEIQEQASQVKRLRELALGSTHGIFDQVRKASQALGNTRLQFEKLASAISIPEGPSTSIKDRLLVPVQT